MDRPSWASSQLTIANVFALIALCGIGTITGWHLPDDCFVEIASRPNDIESDLGNLLSSAHGMANNEHSAYDVSAHKAIQPRECPNLCVMIRSSLVRYDCGG